MLDIALAVISLQPSFALRPISHDNVLLSGLSLEHVLGEEKSGVGHGEGGGPGTGLGLDDLVSAELDADGEGLALLVGHGGVGLTEEGKDGDSGMASDDGDINVLGVLAHVGAKEGVGTTDIKGGDTADLLGVEDALGLEDLGGNGDGGVDGVGDDGEDGVRAVLGATLDEGLDDGSVGVEEIVTGHSGLGGEG